MIRKHRAVSFMALLAVGGLLAASCSQGTTPTTAPASSATSAPTATGSSPSATASAEPLTFGMILVGPQNDHGWSQAHFDAGTYVEQQLGAHMIVIDKVNPADRPDTTVPQVVNDMIDQGATLIFATSDDLKDGIEQAAAEHPDIPMIWSSGDSAWADGQGYKPELTNLGNVMGRMELTKMIAGCAAAMTTQSGKISYLGPLINDETRRLVNSAYLGAKYCWENYLNKDPADLHFNVNWIGFWFNIPGVTLDPTQVTNDFFNSGTDVVLSGIDTTEALVVTGQRAASGESVWSIPYDYKGACDEAPDVCLGVPYFNWGPAYLQVAQSVLAGSFEPTFNWFGPDWSDINNPDTSGVGFVDGDALSSEAHTSVLSFEEALANGLNLYTGPLNYQDGSTYLGDGEVATDQQIWYMPQLLEGMEGASSA
jgi:simple sugar transport system substrate-binding protein